MSLGQVVLAPLSGSADQLSGEGFVQQPRRKAIATRIKGHPVAPSATKSCVLPTLGKSHPSRARARYSRNLAAQRTAFLSGTGLAGTA